MAPCFIDHVAQKSAEICCVSAYPGNSFEDHVLRRHIWTSLIPSTLPLSGDVDFAALAMRYELSGGFIKKLGSCWGEIRDAHRLKTQVLHRPIGHSYIFFRHVTQLFPRCSLSVKTPAVKPCIVYIIVLLCSVGSKQCQQLSGYLPPLLL